MSTRPGGKAADLSVRIGIDIRRGPGLPAAPAGRVFLDCEGTRVRLTPEGARRMAENHDLPREHAAGAAAPARWRRLR